jgi:hypothetical protein
MGVTVAPRLRAGRSHALKSGERLATIDLRYHGEHIRLPVRATSELPAPSLFYRLTRL